MNIRLYHANILTMEQYRSIFEGEVWIKDGKIAYVGDNDEVERFKAEELSNHIKWDQEIDCQGNLLMPGFKDAHTHSAMTFLRSFADDEPLQSWLNEKVFPYEAKLTADDIYHLAKLANLEYLTSGITSIFDMYMCPEATAKACMEMGMRLVLVSGINNFTSSIEQMEKDFVKWNHESELVSYQIGFHAEYTCTKELLTQVAALSHKYRAPVYTHLSETAFEVEECKKRYGMTPAVFLDSLGMFQYGGGCYHSVHLSENDMTIFSKRGLYAITNPGSNTKLASGIAPIKDLLNRHIPVAIGTDGPASNNCLDMFREMFLVTGLAKLREKDAACVDAMEVLKMATVNGARAMGLRNCDVLAKGKAADIILIDLHQPNMRPIHNIPKNLVYSGSKQNVVMTMIGGRILYDHGTFNVNSDIDAIYEKVEEITRRITKGDPKWSL